MSYAPANAKGEKPYVVRLWDFGREREKVVYAPDVASAKYRAGGRRSTGRYVQSARRATPADLEVLS